MLNNLATIIFTSTILLASANVSAMEEKDWHHTPAPRTPSPQQNSPVYLATPSLISDAMTTIKASHDSDAVKIAFMYELLGMAERDDRKRAHKLQHMQNEKAIRNMITYLRELWEDL